jgi:hypothetical protein
MAVATRAMTTTADPATWATEAWSDSLARWSARMTAETSTYSPATVIRPRRRNHGVNRLVGESVSTIAIGAPMLRIT